ncbi:MAG: TraB/GumN family protein [Ferruginibacter sp.]
MYKKNLLTLFPLFLFMSSFGQNSILWKVTNTKTKYTSYILGTYHLIGSGFVDSYPTIKEKINKADLIITETKLDRLKSREYYNSRQSSNMLSTVLPQEDIDYLKEIFKKGKIDLEKFTPGEILLKLHAFYPKFKCSAIKNDDTLVIDEYIQYLGNQNQKKSYFLETDSFGLEKITELTKAYDWKFFKRKIPGILKRYKSNDIEESLCLFANQYTSFDLDYKLNASCNKNQKGIAGTSKMMKTRNIDWMKQIPLLLENNNCFIAVGLFHLYYDCGILEQLKKIGYEVEKVEMK